MNEVDRPGVPPGVAILAAVMADGIALAMPAPGGGIAGVERFSPADCSTFSEALMRYAARHGIAVAGCPLFLSVAGAVGGATVRTTNGRWFVSPSGLKAMTGVAPVVVNHVASLAWATLDMRRATPFGAVAPRAGEPAGRGVLVWASATGLGASCIDRGGGRLSVLDSEAGHMSFAAQDEAEWALARDVARRHGHASCERVVAELLTGGVPGRTEEETARLLCAVLAEYCAAVTLACAAWDGVYLSGPGFERIARTGPAAFRARFEGRGRMRELLRQVPSHLVPDGDGALLGLAILRGRQAAGVG